MPELIEYLEDGCSLEAVPHTYGCVKVRDTFTIPNTYGFDFPTDFGSTSAADTYFHAIDDGGTTYFFPPATTSPSTPTLATNVAGIQAFLTSIGSGITYTVNSFNEIVLTFANPGDESIWSFWMGTSNSPDSWTNKTPTTIHDLRTDSIIYNAVQVVKLKDLEGNYIDKYFYPSTTGPLKEVNLDTFDTFSIDCNNTTSVGMYSALATNASPVTVPANIKSLHILNLGSITNPSVTADIDISGGLVETMLAAEESLVYSVQEDGDSFSNGDIIITPTLGYQAKVRWII